MSERIEQHMLAKGEKQLKKWQPTTHERIDLDDKKYSYKRGHFVEDVIVYILNKYIKDALEKGEQSLIEYVRQDIKADRGSEKTDLFIKFRGYDEEFKFQLTTRQEREDLAKKREKLPRDVVFVVLNASLISELWKDFLNNKVNNPNLTPAEFLNTCDERILMKVRDEYIYELLRALPSDKKERLAYILQGY